MKIDNNSWRKLTKYSSVKPGLSIIGKDISRLSAWLTEQYWKLTPLTRNLCLFFLFNIVLVNVGIMLTTFSLRDTIITHTLHVLLPNLETGTDSWMPMLNALHYLESVHEKPVYQTIFFDNDIKFQYPPTSLLLLYLLKQITPDEASLILVLRLVSWLFVVAMVFFIIKIFNLSFEKNFGVKRGDLPKVDIIIRNIILICLSLTFYPVVKAYSLGQIQVWLNTLFTIVFWCWMKNKKTWAGGLTGAMFLVKPQYLIIALWGFLCRKWFFTIAFSFVVVGGLSISIWLMGIANHTDYLTVLSYISRHGEGYYPNQSVNGLLNRLLFNGNNLEWKDGFPPFNAFVYMGTVVSSAVLIGIALLYTIKSKKQGNILDMAIVALSCTMASPVAWEHHYGILLPIYAFLLPCLIKQPIFGRMTFPFLGLTYILSSNYLPIFNKLASFPVLNILQSYLFIAALMVLVCLYALKMKIHLSHSPLRGCLKSGWL
ncbi:MAG: glycosyltransferase family 87 protein [Nostoc sp.]